MRLYTSYYAKHKNLIEAGVLPVSVSRVVPKFFKGPVIEYVAPTYSMLSGKISREDYIKQYNEILSQLNFDKFINDLQKISDEYHNENLALLCYEKSDDFCHRHLLADWLTSKGVSCIEFDFETHNISSEPLF